MQSSPYIQEPTDQSCISYLTKYALASNSYYTSAYELFLDSRSYLIDEYQSFVNVKSSVLRSSFRIY